MRDSDANIYVTSYQQQQQHCVVSVAAARRLSGNSAFFTDHNTVGKTHRVDGQKTSNK